MNIDRSKHNKFVSKSVYKETPILTTTEDTKTTVIIQGGGSSGGGGGLTDDQIAKLNSILEGALRNQNAISSIQLNLDSGELKAEATAPSTEVAFNIAGDGLFTSTISENDAVKVKLLIEPILKIIEDIVNAKSFWKTDADGNLYTEYNAYSTGELSAYGMGSIEDPTGAMYLHELKDVDTVNLKDKGILQYDSSISKWIVVDGSSIKPDLTGYATETFVNQKIADILDSAPETLDTLNELAAALGDDPNFSTTVMNMIGSNTTLITALTNKVDGFDTRITTNTNNIKLNRIDIDTLLAMFEWDKSASATDKSKWRIKAKNGFYSVGEVSAYGMDPGEVPVGAMYMYELKDVLFNNLTSGQLLKWNGTKWVNIDANEVGLNESELAAYLTIHKYATLSDIPSLVGYATLDWVGNQGFLVATSTDKANWNTSFGWGNHALANYANNNITIIAGVGLTGGGNLTANRTLSLATVGTAGTYTKVTVDAYGRVTGSSTLVASDIPALSISKITGLLAALDSKLDLSDFNKWFTIEYNIDGTIKAIKALHDFYSVGEVSAYGIGSGEAPGNIGYLHELKDVNISNPTDKQTLIYDATTDKWINGEGLSEVIVKLGSVSYTSVNGTVTLPAYPTSFTWDTITNKPTSFIPAAHNLSISTITDVNSAWQTMLKTAPAAYNTRWAAWGDVTGKPSWIGSSKPTYTYVEVGTKTYTNDGNVNYIGVRTPTRTAKQYYEFWDSVGWANIAAGAFVKNGGTSSQFLKADGSIDSNPYITVSSVTWANLANKPATATRWATWSEVTSKPSTFTPSAHNQGIATITDVVSAWQSILKVAPTSYVTRWPSFSEITSKPTTVAGYGITDVYTTSLADSRYVNVSGDTMTGHLVLPTIKANTSVLIGNIYLKYNSTNNALYIEHVNGKDLANFYASGEVSAYGVGTSGGSGTGIILTVYSYSDINGTYADSILTDTFNAYTISKLGSRITVLENSTITSVDWSIITNKPTTIAGYGITNAVLNTDARLTDARNAKDVYAWAKASVKPSYNFTEIKDGGIYFENGHIQWNRNTDVAIINFKNTGDGDTDSYLKFETGDNGNEGFAFFAKAATTEYRIFDIFKDRVQSFYNVTAPKFIKAGGAANQLLRADGGVDTFNWIGQIGQPNWLWGGNAQRDYYVYNPANFHVANANTVGGVGISQIPYGTTSTATTDWKTNAGDVRKSGFYRANNSNDFTSLFIHSSHSAADYAFQIGVYCNNSNLMFRQLVSNVWGSTKVLLDDSNYASIADGRYVKKSGDTMTGALTAPTLSVNQPGETLIRYYSGSTTKTATGWNSSYGSYLYNYPSAKYLGILDSGTPHFQGNVLWHAANDGSGSGLDADLLDGYHRDNMFSSMNDVFKTWGQEIEIEVGGDSNTYYPVVIDLSTIKTWVNRISVYKNLGSKTANYPGNHPDGSSSMWAMYEARYVGWDGNNGFLVTKYNNFGYAQLMANAHVIGQHEGDLVVYLRGGGTTYKIATDYKASIKIYYTTTNVGSSTYPNWVEPTTTIGNGGTVSTVSLHYVVNSANKLQSARTINGTNFDGTANIVTSYWGTTRTLSAGTDCSGSVSINGSGNFTLPITVNTATKLRTARTIWGQSFNGTGNVSGALTGVSTISASGGVTTGARSTFTGGIRALIGSTDDWPTAAIFAASAYPLVLYNPGGGANTRKYYFSINSNWMTLAAANDSNNWVLSLVDFSHNGSVKWYHTNTFNKKIVASDGIRAGYTNDTYRISTDSFICNSWIRTIGTTGWHSETHGGGIHMIDSTWVRIYNGKQFYVSSTNADAIHTAGGIRALGRGMFEGTLTARGDTTLSSNLTVTGAAQFNGIPKTAKWWYSTGSSGWYNETYGGGIYQTDSSYVKVYNNKHFRVNGIISAGEYQDDSYGYCNVTRPNNINACCFSFIRSGMTPFGIGYNTSNEIVIGQPNTSKLMVTQWLRIGNTGMIYAGSFTATSNITANGNITADGNILAKGEVTAFSDVRLKSNINNLLYRGRLIPKTYVKDNKQSIGFIALEVLALYPELVHIGTDENRYLSLNYGNITAVLASQLNGVEDEVSVLKNRVKQLEDRLSRYES